MEWLRELKFKQLENTGLQTLNHILDFLNQSQLLPHGTQIEEVTSEGIFCRDGNHHRVALTELSDGYRSVLSMILELLRQLVRTYGSETVFQQLESGNTSIALPGVVIIDEIDAHLHPTWQTRIGEWFRKVFPQIQFIVTTHSPLICRAVAQGGSIWRLAAPGSTEASGKITGTEAERLIYGNVLDAYGTQAFGSRVTRSIHAHDMLERLAHLNQKLLHGQALEHLSKTQREIDAQSSFADCVKTAERFWKSRTDNQAFREIRSNLSAACGKRQRCCYCEDCLGTDIEHFHPKSLYPDQAFVWENYLYACTRCNRLKSNKFAVFQGNSNGYADIQKTTIPHSHPGHGPAAVPLPLSVLREAVSGSAPYFHNPSLPV